MTLGKLINSLEKRFLSEEEENIIEHFDESTFCDICGYEYYPTVDYFDYFEIYNPNKKFIDKNQLSLEFPETNLKIEMNEYMMSPMISIRTAECNHCGASYFECDCGELIHIDEYGTRFECPGGCGNFYIVHADIDRKGTLLGIEIEIVKVFYCKNCGEEVEEVNEFGYCDVCEEYENISINN